VLVKLLGILTSGKIESYNIMPIFPYILCAAVHFQNEKVYKHQPKNIKTGYVVCGRRHHNCYTTAWELNGETKNEPTKCGFITSNDLFVDRQEAAKIAYEAGQTDEESEGLVSEELY
jgi:hypothetical protein